MCIRDRGTYIGHNFFCKTWLLYVINKTCISQDGQSAAAGWWFGCQQTSCQQVSGVRSQVTDCHIGDNQKLKTKSGDQCTTEISLNLCISKYLAHLQKSHAELWPWRQDILCCRCVAASTASAQSTHSYHLLFNLNNIVPKIICQPIFAPWVNIF